MIGERYTSIETLGWGFGSPVAGPVVGDGELLCSATSMSVDRVTKRGREKMDHQERGVSSLQTAVGTGEDSVQLT